MERSGELSRAGRIIDIHAHYMSPRALSVLQSEHGGKAGELSGVDDLERRREWMAEQGIAFQVFGPELRYARYHLTGQEGAAWSRLVNETTAADLRARASLAALALVPIQAGELAALELEHAVNELGFCGAMIGSQAPGGLHHPDLDPLWQAASDLNVPVVIHSAQPPPEARLERFGLGNLVGRTQEVTLAAAELVLGGVLDRFPRLRPVLVMGGGGLPYLISRLDRQHRLQAGAGRPPSAYLRRFWYDTLVFGPAELRFLLDQVGPSRLMLGSDWPMVLFEPDPVGLIDGVSLSPEDRHLVLGGNAAELFRV